MAGIRIADVKNKTLAGYLAMLDTQKKDGVVSPAEAQAAAKRMKADEVARILAEQVFGAVPSSGTQLLAFAKNPPAEEAASRILGNTIVGVAQMKASGKGNGDVLGADEKGRQVSITNDGKINVAGAHGRPTALLASNITAGARLAANLRAKDLNEVTAKRLFKTLSDALEIGLSKGRTVEKDETFTGAMTLLSSLARAVRSTSRELASAIVERMLQGLGHQRDPNFTRFYVNAMRLLEADFTTAERAAFNRIHDSVYPPVFDVDKVTNNRKKALLVPHTIHPEFWSEASFYERKHENMTFELVSKNKSDSRREYKGVITDPTGKKAPLKLKIIVRKGEFDFLDGTNKGPGGLVRYSGHSSLGGNGSEAVRSSAAMVGSWLAFFENCIGMQNYPELVHKNPNTQFILTESSTYGDDEGVRGEAIYNMLARGAPHAQARAEFAKHKILDEPTDNYVFPDQDDVFSWYGHLDNDAVSDRGPNGVDALYDVRGQRRFADVIRAVGFANSELFWHHQIETENHATPKFPEELFGAIVLDGPIKDPKPGEAFRVTEKRAKDRKGKMRTFYPVQFDPADLRADRDLYAGITTANIIMQVIKHRRGSVPPFEALRAIFMGAQAIDYLDVYSDDGKKQVAAYLKAMGLPALEPQKLLTLIKDTDSHGNDTQVQGFIDLLEKADKQFVLASFVPKLGDTGRTTAVA